MHMARSPTSLPGSASVGAGDSLELSLTGSQLSVSCRPSSASPAKHFSRSVSVTADKKSKRNTLGEAGLGSSRSIKNLRRSNSTTQVNQRVNSCFSEEQSENFLALFDSSSDGRRKLASLSKTSPDLSWNILDDQLRTFLILGSARTANSPVGMKKREAGIALAANFTANNRSNKGAVGNSVTTILHNNCPDKPLTPKSSNQKPASLNNIMKATVNDEGSLENSSLTKSQKNFSSPNNNAAHSSPALLRRQEVTEEEAERFIQQVNHAAVTIQRWYRRHAYRRHTSEAALRRLLSTKKQEREQRTEEGKTQEGQKRKDEDRKRIHKEKAQQARRAAIQELQQKRAQRAVETQRVAEQEIEALKQSGKLGRRKPARPSPGSKGGTAARDTGKG
ncbi:centrosomal protein of 131 kDa-like, partial [Polyodon spathula]|uniref:centrosomal protein of 131 kDa-like n=1 Tax=Polyodon spathula TaxID=7913 RepID=UPI001B7F1F29